MSHYSSTPSHPKVPCTVFSLNTEQLYSLKRFSLS